jgi:CubicO group peptidase (beta-lactamase class C family)
MVASQGIGAIMTVKATYLKSIDNMRRLIISFSLVCFALQAFSQIETIVDELYEEFSETPGAVVAIYKDGEISFSKSYGMANVAHDIPINSKTVFDVGSVSKQFTAACIFLLEQQGKLSIDDPIQKLLPEMPIYNGDTVRIRHLINHISGLRDYVEIMAYAGIPFNNHFTEEIGLDIMSRQLAPNFKPEENFMYNNGGYLLLAIMVRRASGMTIGEFAASQIFEPLGMESTFILENPNRIIKNGATGYSKLRDGTIEELHYKNFAIGGDGQVNTTVEDLFLWDQNFYDPKVGGPQLLERFHQQGVLTNGDTMAYAGGLFIEEYKGHRVVQHTGAWGGFVSSFYRLPDLKKSFVSLSNYRATGSMARIYAIMDGLLPESVPTQGKSTEAKPYKPKRKSFLKYTGLFEVNGEPHKRFSSFVENDTLKVDLWSKQTVSLIPIADGQFQHPQISFMKFDFNQKDSAPTIGQFVGELKSQRVSAYEPLENIVAYSGFYYSEEAQIGYTLSAKGNQLAVERNGEEIYLLDQIRADLFGQKNLAFEFQKVDGQPVAFLLQDRRIRNLKFKIVK